MKLLYYILILAAVFLFISAFTKQKRDIFDFSQKVIDECIKVHGGKAFNNADFSFDFRDKSYGYKRQKGKYIYTRSFTDKEGAVIKDRLTNDDFTRTVNGEKIKLESKKETAYSNALNSVHYFAFLPYFLNDAAVQKKYLGLTMLNDIQYHKIEVTFEQEGGGTDHDDVFVYWIREADFTLDYLAYSYHTNGGGVRFRKAYNQRTVGGIRFQDYVNYKHDNTGFPVDKLDDAFMNDQLKEVSRIDLLNIKPLSGKS